MPELSAPCITALDFDLIRRECGTAPGQRREHNSGNLRTPDGEDTPTEFLPIEPDASRTARNNSTEISFLSFDRSTSDGMPMVEGGMNLSPRGKPVHQVRRQMGRPSDRHREPDSTTLKGLLNSFSMEERLCSARNNGRVARYPPHLRLQIPPSVEETHNLLLHVREARPLPTKDSR